MTCSASTAASSSRRGGPSPSNAASDVRVLVVGNPCNTNCLIARSNAPEVPDRPLVRHDPARREPGQGAAGRQGRRARWPRSPTWPSGATTRPRSSRTSPTPASAGSRPPTSSSDGDWLRGDFITTVQKRGAAIIEARGSSSAASAAAAAIDTVVSLRTATPAGDSFSVAVASHRPVRGPRGPPVRLPRGGRRQGRLVRGRGLRPRRVRPGAHQGHHRRIAGRAQRRQGAGPHRVTPPVRCRLDPFRPRLHRVPSRPPSRHRAVFSRETTQKHMPGTLRPVGDLFDGYGASATGLTEAAFDEMVGPRRLGPGALRGGRLLPGPDGPRRRLGPRLPPGPGLHGPGRHLRPRRRGATVPPRRGAAHLHLRRVVPGRGRGGPAGARPRALPGRRVRGGPDRQRRPHPPRRGHQLTGVRARRVRLHAAQRRAHPRRRHRRDPGRGRRVPGARGQPAQPVGRELRAGQPGRHGAGAAGAVLGPADPDGHRLPGPPDQRAAPLGARVGAGADGGGPHARRAQLGLLRARAAGPPHGRPPGRGPRPRVPRHRRVPAHHRGRGAGPRDLPAHRRRVPRPAAVPARVAGGLPGHRERGAGGPGDHRQRRRQRRRRRQAGLHATCRP